MLKPTGCAKSDSRKTLSQPSNPGCRRCTYVSINAGAMPQRPISYFSNYSLSDENGLAADAG
jgi:hypothetical protein